MTVYVTSGLIYRRKRKKEFDSLISDREKTLSKARKPYKPSKWASNMVSAIKKQSDKDGNLTAGGCVLNELDKRGAFKGVPEHAQKDINNHLKQNKINEGGFGDE